MDPLLACVSGMYSDLRLRELLLRLLHSPAWALPSLSTFWDDPSQPDYADRLFPQSSAPLALGSPEGAAPPRPVPAQRIPKTWVRFRVVDDATREPWPGIRLNVRLPDGSESIAITNSKGVVALSDIDAGPCELGGSPERPGIHESVAFVGMGEAEIPGPASDPGPDAGPVTILRIVPHRVRTDQTLSSIAEAHGLDWRAPARFNWDTDSPAGINRPLRDFVGCTKRSGWNYEFQDSDTPGLIYVPFAWSQTLATTETHTIRVRRVRPKAAPAAPAPAVVVVPRGEPPPAGESCTIPWIVATCGHRDNGIERSAYAGGVLEVVPDRAYGPDEIELRAGCGHAEWRVDGKPVRGPLRVSAPTMAKFWLPGAKPDRHLLECAAHGQTKRLEVLAYPSRRWEAHVDVGAAVDKIRRITRFVEEAVELGGGFEIEGDCLKGQVVVDAEWKEHEDHRAFYAYKIDIGFDPLVAVAVQWTLGVDRITKLARRIRSRGAIELNGVPMAGQDALVHSWIEGRNAIRGDATVTATEADGRVLAEYRGEFTVPEPPPAEFWDVARPIAWSPGAREEARRLVSDLNATLQRRNFDRADELLRYRTLEIARSHHFDPGRAVQSHREFLEFAVCGEMEPLPPTLEFHLVAEARLVWITREKGAPVLRSRRARRLALSLYAAPVDGRWTPVR